MGNTQIINWDPVRISTKNGYLTHSSIVHKQNEFWTIEFSFFLSTISWKGNSLDANY